MQTRSCDISPTGDQDKYTIGLVARNGEWIGLDVDLSQIIPQTVNVPAPQQQIEQHSLHMGRGADRWLPNTYNFKDNQNGWRTTQGKYHATILWEFAKGLRNADENMPADNGVTWKKLVGSDRSLAVSFAASASYDATQILMHIRKGVAAGTLGRPGTLTVELCADDSDPDTVLQTVTLDASDVDDVVSLINVFTFDAAETTVATTTYWVKIYGASTDELDACWEVGCDNDAVGVRHATPTTDAGSWNETTYSPYFRVTDADAARKMYPFVFDGALYAVGVYDNGTTTSKLFINGLRGRATSGTATTLVDTSHGSYGATALTVDRYIGWYIRILGGTGAGQVRAITDSDATSFTVATWTTNPDATSTYIVYGGEWFVEIASAFSKPITGRPVVSQGLVYFPMGDSEPLAVMGIDYTDADDHVFDLQTETGVLGDAFILASGFDSATGPQMFRANNASGTGSGGKVGASRAALATSTVYTTDLAFNAVIYIGDNTYTITNIIFHENRLHVFKEDTLFVIENDRPVQIKMGSESYPSVHNGVAAVTATDRNLYVNRGNEVMVVSGGGAYPTGLAQNLPVARSGYVSDLKSEQGWIFGTIDAGDGTSSVMLYAIDTQTWSEHLRAFTAGKRMRGIQWQGCPETNPMLWIDCGGELIFQKFPKNEVRPLNDTTVRYWHETVLELAPIDLLSVDNKYFSRLTATTKGLASEGDTEAGHKIVVEYQCDNDVDTANWLHAGEMTVSPSDKVEIDKGGKRILGLRLRLISSEATDPVILENIKLSLFTRKALSHQWQIFFPIYPDDDEQDSLKLLQWLRKHATDSNPLTMKSTFWLYHNREVTITDEPYYRVVDYEASENEVEATAAMILAEVI